MTMSQTGDKNTTDPIEILFLINIPVIDSIRPIENERIVEEVLNLSIVEKRVSK